MNGKNTKPIPIIDEEPDWTRFDALTDEDIRKAREADPDAAPFLDKAWFERARVVDPPGKATITIRLDKDVLAFFKAKGERYQTRINAVLRSFMELERARIDSPQDGD